MIYTEAIEKLNSLSPEELEADIFKLQNPDFIDSSEFETLFNKVIGCVFSVSKEIKNDELYRVCPGKEPLEKYDDFWTNENGYLRFSADPITPFFDNNVKENSYATLLTYRKINDANPSALMLEGLPEDSGVFDILSNDGFTESGKQNYLKICCFIKDSLNKANAHSAFAEKVKSVLDSGELSPAYSYSSSDAQYCVFNPEYVKDYYRCTSSIVCRFVFSEGGNEKIHIQPVKHNICAITPENPVEYEDFGEVGLFTFEMDDYK